MPPGEPQILASQSLFRSNHLDRKKLRNIKVQGHQQDFKLMSYLIAGINEMTPSHQDYGRNKIIYLRVQGHTKSIRFSWSPGNYASSFRNPRNPMTSTPRDSSTLYLPNLVLGLTSREMADLTKKSHDVEGVQPISSVKRLFFIFDRNGPSDKSSDSKFIKAKVAPPRLNGQKVGVFASRTPHRPNPLGLTLARLDRLEGDCLHLSGLDILDSTPIVDIKPYIPEYDQPPEINKYVKCEVIGGGLHQDKDKTQIESSHTDNTLKLADKAISHNACERTQFKRKIENVDKTERSKIYDLNIENEFDTKEGGKDFIDKEENISTNEKLAGEHDINNAKIAPWLLEPPVSQLEVVINPRAEKQIILFSSNSHDQCYRLNYLKNSHELFEAICSVLKEDPRSIYRRQKCSSQLYFFTVDTAHITVWFDQNIAEVLKVKPAMGQE
ncbi:unnamed protein product, partial [Meganyctiphanes norvegica]